MRSYQSQNVVVGRNFAATILAALGTRPAAALLATPKVRLSMDPSFNPTPDSTVAGLAANEANFSGYTAGGYAPTMSGPVNLAGDISGVTANVLPIATTATPFVSATCYGYWIDDGVNVIVAEKFAGGVTANFGSVGDYLDLQVSIPVELAQSTQ